jgi:predicted phosphoadenosine phosphosulfate sulfurtransferase
MAIKTIESRMNVVEAAKRRIVNVFSNGVRVYMSFSAGKDSLCISHLVYEKILSGEIDPKLLTVIFIDEEALYDSMEQMALRWRKRFISVGAEFRWYCLPVKQVSILHQLQNDEAWITWEPGKTWVRDAPPFAITRDPHLKYTGQMNYQTFCSAITKDGIQMIGVRAYESVQRREYLAKADLRAGGLSCENKVFPIYDWKDSDIWLYIKENHLDFPDAYIDLYRVGVSRHRLRLCNFFAAESIAGLRYIAETDAKLWERIEQREPNAYLTLLYWDSEMFKRSTRKRTALEGESTKDYRELCRQMLFVEPEKHFTNEGTRRVADRYRRFYIKSHDFMRPRDFKHMYEAVIAGDPKLRTLRALYVTVYSAYAKYAGESATARREVKADV